MLGHAAVLWAAGLAHATPDAPPAPTAPPPSAAAPDETEPGANAPAEATVDDDSPPVGTVSAGATDQVMGAALGEVVRARPPRGSLRIVYTGALGGVGSGHTSFAADALLAEAASRTGGRWTTGTLDHGTLVRDGHILRTDGQIAPVLAFMRGGEITCGAPTSAWSVTTTTDVVLFETPPEERFGKMVEALLRPHATHDRRTCTNAAGAEATLWSPAGAALPPSFAPELWEFRRALASDAALLIGRPIDEASRRVARIAALTQLKGPTPTVFVDAGNFVDGASSVRDGQLSLHRDLGFEILERLGPAALVPGQTELVAGAAQLHDELASRDLPYIATNWQTSAEAAHLELPDARVIEVETAAGTVRVGFVGILSPEVAALSPALAQDGVTISDPVSTVQPVIDRLHEEGNGVDMVVALTTADGALLARLRRKLRGVDVLIGDPTFATLRVERREADLRDLPAELKGAPLTAPMDGLATLDVVFEGTPVHPARVGIESVHLTDDAPRDEAVARRVMQTRLSVYPPLDRPLVGAPEDGEWTEKAWSDLVCQSVLQATDADVALLRELPRPPGFPGPASALTVVDSLAVLDTLEIHQVPGSSMQRLSDRAGTIPVVCGLSPGAKLYKVGARWLDPDRSYRIVTSSVTVSGTPTGDILSGLRSSRLLDKPGIKPVLREDGRPLTLHSAAMQRLEELAADGMVADTEEIVRDETPALMQPLWLLRMRQISLSTESFEGVDDDTFAAVPETLVTSPSSFTFGTIGDVALEYTSEKLWTDVRYRTTFTKLRIGEDPAEETADDWVLSTSWALPGAAIPADRSFQAMPYTELSYDSDYTPVELEDGTLSTHQSDLSLALGMAALRTGPIRTLRAGMFANRDMARLDEKPAEYGGKLDWETYKSLAGGAVVWTTTGTVQLWMNTPDDDESDLRMRSFAETRFALPLARWLNISMYGQGLLVQGRVPATDSIGGTYLLGASLDAVGALRL